VAQLVRKGDNSRAVSILIKFDGVVTCGHR
jgi:hypothetical protein